MALVMTDEELEDFKDTLAYRGYTDDEIEDMVWDADYNEILEAAHDADLRRRGYKDMPYEDIEETLREAGFLEPEEAAEQEEVVGKIRDVDMAYVLKGYAFDDKDQVYPLAQFPEREVLLAPFSNEDMGRDHLLQIAFGDKGDTWTEYRRLGTKLFKPSKASDLNEIYEILRAITQNRQGSYDDYDKYALRWQVLPQGSGTARHRDATRGSKENCVVRILSARFPSQAGALRRIALEDGAWGQAQDRIASNILKRNIECRDELDQPMWKVGSYRETKAPPVVYYGKGGHALQTLPARMHPDRVCLVPDSVKQENLYATVHAAFGGSVLVFPVGAGIQIQIETNTVPDVVAVRGRESWEEVCKRAEELEIPEKDVRSISAPFGVETLAWRRRCGFESTGPVVRDFVEAANLFPIPYFSHLPPDAVAPHGYDMNLAYFSSPEATGATWERYGFPAGEGVVVDEPGLAVLERTGFVLAELEVLHPWVAVQLRVPEGSVTRQHLGTMRLASWVSRGWVRVMRIERAVLYVPSWPAAASVPLAGTSWPEDKRKHWGRVAVGRLVAKSESDYILCPNAREAMELCYRLNDAGRLESVEKFWPALDIEGLDELMEEMGVTVPASADERAEAREAELFKVSQSLLVEAALAELLQEPPDDGFEARAQEFCESADREAAGLADDEPGYVYKIGVKGEAHGCAHVHGYYLDYTAIRLEDQIAAHEWSAIAKLRTDSILLVKGESYGDIDEGPGPGQWKKERGYTDMPYASVTPRPVPEPSAALLAAARGWWAPLADPVHFVEGPAGFGKTTKCLDSLPPGSVMLTPTHKLRRKYRRERPGLPINTWQYVLWPGKKFDPVAADMRLPFCISVVYFTEALTIPKNQLQPMLEYLRGKNIRVIMDGDRMQMRPYDGEFAAAWMDSEIRDGRIGYTWFADKDYRSVDADTASLKAGLRGLSNEAAMARLTQSGFRSSYEAFLQDWHPRDYVLITTNLMRDRVHVDLARIHAEKYPDELMRIRYSYKNKARSGEEEFVPLGTPMRDHASLAYSITYSVCQGDTIVAPARVWMFDHRLGGKFMGAVYVGATRVRDQAQLSVVTPPDESGDDYGVYDD